LNYNKNVYSFIYLTILLLTSKTRQPSNEIPNVIFFFKIIRTKNVKLLSNHMRTRKSVRSCFFEKTHLGLKIENLGFLMGINMLIFSAPKGHMKIYKIVTFLKVYVTCIIDVRESYKMCICALFSSYYVLNCWSFEKWPRIMKPLFWNNFWTAEPMDDAKTDSGRQNLANIF